MLTDFNNPILHLPFDLAVDEYLLHCEKLLRVLPNNRLVIAGRFRGQPVLVKVFLTPCRGWLAFNRALRGTQSLLAAQLPTPAILYAGRLKTPPVFIILFELLDCVVPLNTCLESTLPRLERLACLRQLIQTVASQHEAGIVQHDLHLQNFLLSKETLYTIDTGSVRLHASPLNRRKSLNALALLLSQLNRIDVSLQQDAIEWYFQCRGWSFTQKISDDLMRVKAYWQRQYEKKHRSKLFRTSSQFVAERQPRHFWVCDRSALNDQLLAFLNSPEYFFSDSAMRVIKQDQTTTVGVISMAGRDYVVKRYNRKSIGYRLMHVLRSTRAKIAWEGAHRLLWRGIHTPKPIAMITCRAGFLPGESYFVSEYLPGTLTSDYFKPRQLDVAAGQRVADEISQVLDTLVSHKIEHGDLKATNVLIHEAGIALLDLDAVRFYRSHFWFRWRANKDHARWMKNWRGQPIVTQLFIK